MEKIEIMMDLDSPNHQGRPPINGIAIRDLLNEILLNQILP